MNYTSNYNLMLPEGTDLVNYLTQTNPNFTSLDTTIKGVSDATVTTATEVTTGTAHAISRTLPDANVIRFTATSNWATGDTMTIDGTPVTPLKTDGTSLKTGDYLIGAAVLGILDATRFTVLVASSPDASDINYDNSLSGLSATKVQGAIDENASNINTINTDLTVANDYYTLNTTLINDIPSASKTVTRYGKMVKFMLNSSVISSVAGTGAVLLTLPIGFRPTAETRSQLLCNYNGSFLFTGVKIKTDGEVVTSIGSGTLTGVIQIDGCFII